MNIEKLKYYIDLYECRNFTETAKKNFISQASISQYVNALEKDFEVKLFDRTTSPIEPTIAGTEFYNQARLLLKQYEEMRGQVINSENDNTPVLRIAYTFIPDLTNLMDFIDYLKQEGMDVEIELEKVRLKDIELSVSAGICDLGLSLSDNLRADKLSQITVKSGDYQALVPAGHPLFEHEHITPKELYRYPLVLLSEEHVGQSFDEKKVKTVAGEYYPNIAKTVRSFEEGVFYSIKNQLIGFSMADIPLGDLSNRLRKIPIDGESHRYEVVLSYREDRPNAVLKEFLGHLANFLS